MYDTRAARIALARDVAAFVAGAIVRPVSR